jgi:hypothetical protein
VVGDKKFVLVGAGVAVVALGVVLYMLSKKGAAASAGEAIGGAAVDTASGVVTGVVGGIGDGFGLPSPSETITDAAACKVYMDANGYFKASEQCSAPAFFEALTM